jgi:hypothetical protein
MKSTRAFASLFALIFALGLGCKAEAPKEDPAAAKENAAAKKDEHAGHSGPEGHRDHAAAPGATSQPGATPKGEVFFVFPNDGAKIFATSTVVFGVKGDLAVAKAGEHIGDKTKGHHHLIIDGAPVPKGTVVPMDEKHIHFGKGQTETEVKLAEGKHTLTMQFAGGEHGSYGPDLAKTINVEVVADPAEKKVFFESPKDGAKVQSPVKLKFGIKGFSVRPAGEDPKDKTSGHHHIVVDGAPIPPGQPVPKDEKNIHFGKGQTEAELELAPGKHTLTLQLADGLHLSYGAKVAETISIEVTGPAAANK